LLHLRIISSVIVIGVLAALVTLDVKYNLGIPGLWLGPVCMILTGMAVHEALAMLRRQHEHAPIAWSTQIGALLTVGGAIVPVGTSLLWGGYPQSAPLEQSQWPMIGLAVGAIVAYVAEIYRFKHPGGAVERVALSIFIMTYIGLMMSFFAALRLLQDGTSPDEDWGIVALLSLIFVVKMSDIGAYASGRTLGRNKMSPHLSPGKTWEGFIGGMLLASLSSCLFFWLIAPRFVSDPVNMLRAGAYGVVIAVSGVGGDLAVSLLKRDSGKKDSSTWLLGLGGVLDILDSVMLAAPVAYLAWKFGLVGPF
jgi:phosphatidate cytidylyltransferase